MNVMDGLFLRRKLALLQNKHHPTGKSCTLTRKSLPPNDNPRVRYKKVRQNRRKKERIKCTFPFLKCTLSRELELRHKARCEI